MDIGNWPINKIMQLPDWCFGRRWFIGLRVSAGGTAAAYAISEERMPERCVVWGMLASTIPGTAGTTLRFTLRLSEVVPVAATLLTMPRVFPGLCRPQSMYEFWKPPIGTLWVNIERHVIEQPGKCMVAAVAMVGGTGTWEGQIAIQISSVPREVPDWLVSGPGKNL